MAQNMKGSYQRSNRTAWVSCSITLGIHYTLTCPHNPLSSSLLFNWPIGNRRRCRPPLLSLMATVTEPKNVCIFLTTFYLSVILVDPNFDIAAFRTDTDISRNGPAPRERELQAWSDESTSTLGPPLFSKAGDDDTTFGPNASTGPQWDQFAANKQMFGVTTTFNEEVYTTKLDRSRPDYKERERQAIQLANEIQNVRHFAT